jgi:hypothetical protein
MMKALGSALIALLLVGTVALPRAAGAADTEAFVAAYRKAFEAKDTATLQGFLYDKGADPVVLDFYKSMQAQQAGQKITSIELVDLTPAEAAEAAKPKDGPSGKLTLPVIPTKKLVIKIATKNENGSSTSTTSNFIAEIDGKLVIPVPGPAK